MAFSAKQLLALKRSLDGRQIRTRQAHGRELSYIEGWFAISEANRIFGFDGWSRETVESRCVLARENRGTFTAVYIAKVRITVQADGATIIREGHGSGEDSQTRRHPASHGCASNLTGPPGRAANLRTGQRPNREQEVQPEKYKEVKLDRKQRRRQQQ